jgi:hypothetical protein
MLLNQPFPGYHFTLNTVRYTFYAGLSVSLVLVLLRPFGFDELPINLLFRNAVLYGVVTFIIASLNALLAPKIFPHFFKEEKWTIGKEMIMMLWQIVSISIGNIFLTHFLYGNPIDLYNIVMFLGITTVVGIFPVTLIVLLKQQILLKKYSEGAKSLGKQLTGNPSHEITNESHSSLIHFTGDNQNEKISLPLEDFRFISSVDNYIKIHFIKQGILSTYVLRSSLKKAEHTLTDYPQLFRCHRTYIVNLGAVSNVTGNAQGYKLHLKGTDEIVPVSRSLNSELTGLVKRYMQFPVNP